MYKDLCKVSWFMKILRVAIAAACIVFIFSGFTDKHQSKILYKRTTMQEENANANDGIPAFWLLQMWQL